jgi:hypothetical protein
MLVLLDEQLPHQLAREINGHQVSTVKQRGWAGLKNGELLRVAADAGFEVLVTADRNLQFQQNSRCLLCLEYSRNLNARHETLHRPQLL